MSSLSCAIDSAMAVVRSVSAAQMRRCLAPMPRRTSDPSVRRRVGMPRSSAARTMERVLGPSCTSRSNPRRRLISAARSKGSSAIAAMISRWAVRMHSTANDSSSYATTTL